MRGAKAVTWQGQCSGCLGEDTDDNDRAHHSDKRYEGHARGANCRLRGPNGDRRKCHRQRHQQEQDEDG